MSPDAFELVLRLAQCLNYDDGMRDTHITLHALPIRVPKL